MKKIDGKNSSFSFIFIARKRIIGSSSIYLTNFQANRDKTVVENEWGKISIGIWISSVLQSFLSLWYSETGIPIREKATKNQCRLEILIDSSAILVENEIIREGS